MLVIILELSAICPSGLPNGFDLLLQIGERLVIVTLPPCSMALHDSL